MSEGSSLPTSPAGELSDSPTVCPPNTPSTSGNVSPSNEEMLDASSPPPRRESSPSIFTGTPNASSSSISMSSASTLCASSSSSTLVSLSSSPVNSGNPSKEASPSSPREPSIEVNCESSSVAACANRTEKGESESSDVCLEIDQQSEVFENNSSCEVEAEAVSFNPEISSDDQKETDGISGISTELPDNTATDSSTAAIESSQDVEAVTNADGESVILDENGVKMVVKQGYVMVPILTPYYDPSG